MIGIYKATGEIDLATAAEFGADLRDHIDRSDETMVDVDCAGVSFMSSAGYHELIDATEYATRRGHTLVIRNLTAPCARLLRLCDSEGGLRIEPALERRRSTADASRLEPIGDGFAARAVPELL